MPGIGPRRPFTGLSVVALLCALGTGCLSLHHDSPPDVPRELSRVSLPPYIIESPDILLIDAVRLVPRPPYRIEALDALAIRVVDAKPGEPIAGIYEVGPEGTVSLGFDYGKVRVVGMTLEQAKAAITRQLQDILKPPFQVSVEVAESRALQQVRGPHLVRIDGTVSLGVYGSVYVDDLTIEQAKQAIEQHLSQFLLNPEISLDVSGFNSKVFYVIADGAGAGEQVTRLPVTSRLTVLDALGLVNGLPPVANKCNIWVARPTPDGACGQTLPVDWVGITQRGETCTNYQVLPGDRIYIQAAPLITLDTYLARLYSPIERTFGVILLGTSTVQQFRFTQGTGTGGTTGLVR